MITDKKSKELYYSDKSENRTKICLDLKTFSWSFWAVIVQHHHIYIQMHIFLPNQWAVQSSIFIWAVGHVPALNWWKVSNFWGIHEMNKLRIFIATVHTTMEVPKGSNTLEIILPESPKLKVWDSFYKIDRQIMICRITVTEFGSGLIPAMKHLQFH